MVDAVLSVTHAGPLVSLQDHGRLGHLRFGVSPSGPMDRVSFDAANAAVGNPLGQRAIEVSLGGIRLRCKKSSVTCAVAGGNFVVQNKSGTTSGWCVFTLQEGDDVTIRAGKKGSWAYLAFAGNIDADPWLGSHATHSISGFGGQVISSGQQINISDAASRTDREGDIVPFTQENEPIRAVLGPQDRCFFPTSISALSEKTFCVSDAYDRMGMRLDGYRFELDGALSIASEPCLRGSIQISGDGVATVLLADHQATGGYPKIATVIGADIDRLVQKRAGDKVKFSLVSHEAAIEIAREYHARKAAYLDEISQPKGTLTQRLMRENLNHGCLFD